MNRVEHGQSLAINAAFAACFLMPARNPAKPCSVLPQVAACAAPDASCAANRHEWLDQYMFETIKEVQDYTTDWLWKYYNNDHPNMGLGGITPTQKLKQQLAA